MIYQSSRLLAVRVARLNHQRIKLLAILLVSSSLLTIASEPFTAITTQIMPPAPMCDTVKYDPHTGKRHQPLRKAIYPPQDANHDDHDHDMRDSPSAATLPC